MRNMKHNVPLSFNFGAETLSPASGNSLAKRSCRQCASLKKNTLFLVKLQTEFSS